MVNAVLRFFFVAVRVVRGLRIVSAVIALLYSVYLYAHGVDAVTS